MEESLTGRVKRVIGWIGAILLALMGAVALLLSLCGLLVWLAPDGDVESGRICFFVGLVGFVLFGVPAFLWMRSLQKKKTVPSQETPSNGSFGERLKRMGGCGCAALAGMCSACALVMLGGLIMWIATAEIAGMVIFLIGLACLAFFAGIGLVLPYVQWKKGIDVPEGSPGVIAVKASEPAPSVAEPSYGGTSTAKKRGVKAIAVVALSMAGIAVFIFGGMGVNILMKAEEYRRVYDYPLVVSGVICEHDSYDDDGDTDYRSYVRYQANGTMYVEKYQDKDKEEDLAPIGAEVTFEVNPEHPDKLLSYMRGTSTFAIVVVLGAMAALAVGYWTCLHSKRRSGQDAHMDDDVLRKNLTLTVFGRWRVCFWLLAALSSVFCVWRYPMLYGEKTLWFAAACLGVWVISMIFAVRDFSCVRRGEYEVHRDVLAEKEIISGDDGSSDTYRLIYRSSHNGKTWKADVLKARYDRERVGNVAHAVYIKGRKTPTMHYDMQGDIG